MAVVEILESSVYRGKEKPQSDADPRWIEHLFLVMYLRPEVVAHLSGVRRLQAMQLRYREPEKVARAYSRLAFYIDMFNSLAAGYVD